MPEVHIDVDEGEGQATVYGREIPDSAWACVRDAIEFGGRDVRVVGNRRLELPVWALLRARDDLRYAVNELRKANVNVAFGDSAAKLLRASTQRQLALKQPAVKLSNLELAATLRLRGFTRELKEYQVKNVAKLLSVPAGATFSVPGAGKTSEALAYYAVKRSDSTKLIVISPKNAFSVWEEQIGLCLPTLRGRVCRLRGTQGELEHKLESGAEVFLINYDLVPRNLKLLTKVCLQNSTFIFLDESHRIKAWPTKVIGSAILSLAPFSSDRLAMSGTPMPNSPSDLLPQYAFLYPEARLTNDEVVGTFSEVFVRTTKVQLDLPPLIRLKDLVPMDDEQSELYKALTSEFVGNFAGLSPTDRLAFRRTGKAVIRLIQAVSEPALLINSDLRQHELLKAATLVPAPKIRRACELARSLARDGLKCIIWTNFIGNVLQISELLKDLGAEYIYGDVQTSEDDQILDSREAKIKRFKERDDCFVLVANPAACAESISLHQVCHHAIYVDRTYNAGQYLQSEDRIHRLGLAKDQITYVHLLMSAGTVDESVERRLELKVKRMSEFLNDPGLSVSTYELADDDALGLDSDDLQDLRRILGVDP